MICQGWNFLMEVNLSVFSLIVSTVWVVSFLSSIYLFAFETRVLLCNLGCLGTNYRPDWPQTHRSACLCLPQGLKACAAILGTAIWFLGKCQFECERWHADAMARRIFFHAGTCIPYLKILVFISRIELVEDLNTGIWHEHRGNLDHPLQRKLRINGLICWAGKEAVND